MNNLIGTVIILGTLSTPVQAHQWSCKDVPYWIKSYSTEQIASTTRNLGMAPWEINRLMRCLLRQYVIPTGR